MGAVVRDCRVRAIQSSASAAHSGSASGRVRMIRLRMSRSRPSRASRSQALRTQVGRRWAAPRSACLEGLHSRAVASLPPGLRHAQRRRVVIACSGRGVEARGTAAASPGRARERPFLASRFALRVSACVYIVGHLFVGAGDRETSVGSFRFGRCLLLLGTLESLPSGPLSPAFPLQTEERRHGQIVLRRPCAPDKARIAPKHAH